MEEQIIALLLGEVPTKEAAQLQEQIQAKPELAAFQRKMASTLGLVREASATLQKKDSNSPQETRLSEDRRQALLARFRTPKKPLPDDTKIFKLKWLVPVGIAAAIALIGLFTLPTLEKARTSSQRNVALAERRFQDEKRDAPRAGEAPNFGRLAETRVRPPADAALSVDFGTSPDREDAIKPETAGGFAANEPVSGPVQTPNPAEGGVYSANAVGYVDQNLLAGEQFRQNPITPSVSGGQGVEFEQQFGLSSARNQTANVLRQAAPAKAATTKLYLPQLSDETASTEPDERQFGQALGRAAGAQHSLALSADGTVLSENTSQLGETSGLALSQASPASSRGGVGGGGIDAPDKAGAYAGVSIREHVAREKARETEPVSSSTPSTSEIVAKEPEISQDLKPDNSPSTFAKKTDPTAELNKTLTDPSQEGDLAKGLEALESTERHLSRNRVRFDDQSARGLALRGFYRDSQNPPTPDAALPHQTGGRFASSAQLGWQVEETRVSQSEGLQNAEASVRLADRESPQELAEQMPNAGRPTVAPSVEHQNNDYFYTVPLNQESSLKLGVEGEGSGTPAQREPGRGADDKAAYESLVGDQLTPLDLASELKRLQEGKPASTERRLYELSGPVAVSGVAARETAPVEFDVPALKQADDASGATPPPAAKPASAPAPIEIAGKKIAAVEKKQLSEESKGKLQEKEGLSRQPEKEGRALIPPVPQPKPEILTTANPYSTFSLNVSDVAFKLAAASLAQGVMPDKPTIRSEEFLNALNYHDPAPLPGAKLAFAWDQAQSPFEHNRDLIRFSIQTAAWGRQQNQPLNIVLLLDNSGSMEREDRVEIVRVALHVLAQQLTPADRISVVAFARTPRLWVDALQGGNPDELTRRVGSLNPEGGTNLELALELAYKTAQSHFLPNGNNRVILLTDGAANLGNVNPLALKETVEYQRRKGIALDCFGIGWEGYNDDLLEVLSRNGDGRYGFINDPRAAANDFAAQLTGALRVAAANVKAQVEFNPERVLRYRQIGYEKHQLAKEQFRDNMVDAAEIGAAESGTALYSIQVKPNGVGPLGVVRVRYKVPATGRYEEEEWLLPYNPVVPSLDQAYPSLRLAAVASSFAEWLANSPYAANVSLSNLQQLLAGIPETFPNDQRPRELLTMIQQARSLSSQ